jgi:hypothetical protein
VVEPVNGCGSKGSKMSQRNKGIKMSYRKVRSARIGFAALVVMILVAGFCGDAFAKHGRRPLDARNGGAKSGESFQLVRLQPVRLGPMRYYGGPKSPMGRGPAEN